MLKIFYVIFIRFKISVITGTVCAEEKPQSVSKNGAYRLSKTSIPFPQTLLTFFKKQGSGLKSRIFITARRAQRCLRTTKHKKIQLKIENCKDLTEKVRNWRDFDEAELEIIVKNFEKVPREEWATRYIPYITYEIAEKLMQIGEKYKPNTNLLCIIISALENLISRLKIDTTDTLYSFFLQFANQPKTDYFVAIHIDNFPQFNESKNKWEYIFSILNIRPKQKSFQVFISKISRILYRKEDIPQEYFEKLTEMLNKLLADETKNVWTEKEYSYKLELLNQCKSV
ncbi:MAG: hypothetical protein LBG92_11460 [Prevotellaceae bacterium]|jgi:hypothetical protein|nr:hypothetical protein [Prevotellaceae bacterium]